MTENDFILFDRIEVIKKTIEKYGEENFYISFSGGKDSTVLHHLIDEAIPGNKIPRVFMNTGIEYNDIRRFVEKLTENDDYSFLVYLRYKYDFEEEWTYSTECAAWNACEDCVSWLNDWYEGQQNVEYLAISKLGEEYDC